MNPETNTTTEMIPLSEAIVTAAKPTRVRKPKTPSIVDEIISDLRSGKYTQESLATLARLFNREFVAEPLVEKKPRKSKKDTPIVETTVDEAANVEAPKEKKPRKSKKDTPVVETTVDNKDTSVDEDASSAVAVKEKKPRKSKKETVKASTPVLEPADFIPEMVQELEELPDLASRLEGFLEEEELSDIELDDDDE